MADRDPSGPGDGTGVDNGNDGFAEAFASIAAGKTPEAPTDGNDGGDDDDEAGLDGAEAQGDEPSPSDGDGKDPPAKAPADEAAAGKEAPDPWVNATPEMIAERDRLKGELETARRSDEGSRRRASGLQRQLNELRGTAAAQPPPRTEGEGKDPTAAKAALDEKIKQLREDYPEVAGPLIEILEGQRRELDELRGRVTPVIEADQQEAAQAAVQELASVHKDWQSFGIADSPEYTAWLATQPTEVQQANRNFRAWLADQPASIQALSNSWDAREVSVAITLFKTERAEAARAGGQGDETPGKTDATDERRRRQLDGGRAVGSRPGSAASGAPEDFEGAFQHFAGKAKK